MNDSTSLRKYKTAGRENTSGNEVETIFSAFSIFLDQNFLNQFFFLWENQKNKIK